MSKILKSSNSRIAVSRFFLLRKHKRRWLSLNPRNVRSANTSTNLSTVDISSQLPANGQENQKTIIDSKQLESLIFAQLLANNIIKNLANKIYGIDSEVTKILTDAVGGTAAETATILDKKNIEFTAEHLKTVKLVDDAMQLCTAGPSIDDGKLGSQPIVGEKFFPSDSEIESISSDSGATSCSVNQPQSNQPVQLSPQLASSQQQPVQSLTYPDPHNICSYPSLPLQQPTMLQPNYYFQPMQVPQIYQQQPQSFYQAVNQQPSTSTSMQTMYTVSTYNPVNSQNTYTSCTQPSTLMTSTNGKTTRKFQLGIINMNK
jgi:hypothetical protein